MDTTLSLLFSVLLNWIIAEYVNAGACPSANTPVIGACVSSYSVNVSTVYINSGTAPVYVDSICTCDITPQTGGDSIIIYNTWISETGKQTVEILNNFFNRTIYVGEIRITGRTNIFIKTDGVGGVCVSIYTASSNYMDVSCYPPLRQSTQKWNTITSTIGKPTATFALIETTDKTSQNETIISDALPTSELDKETNPIIGPVIGGVIGGVCGMVALVSMVVIVIYRVRKPKRDQKSNATYYNQNNTINIQRSIFTTTQATNEDSSRPTYYNQATRSMGLSQNDGPSYESVQRSTESEHIYLKVAENISYKNLEHNDVNSYCNIRPLENQSQ